jgi:hypothetical protein
MRALRRVATPVAVIVTGCSFPVDEFKDPVNTKADVGLTTNQDAANDDDDTAKPDTRTDTTPPCVCIKASGPNCKEWSPLNCEK